MNRRHLVLIGTLAVLVAVGATYGVFRMIRRSIVETQAVVVANTRLQPGGTIQPEQLKTVSYPVTAIPKGTYANTTEVIGLAVLVPIEENEPILSRKLATKDAGSGLPVRIPAGMRAVSVRVNDVVSVTGFAKAGTHVDVLVTGNPNRDRDPSRIVTTTILEQVEVLCAGKECLEKGDDKPADAQAVTLLVTPADAQKVMLAASEGRILLSLRNPLDKDKQEPPVLLNAALYRIPETKAAKLGSKGNKQNKETATPSPLPPPPYVVELIRGDKRDKAQF